MKSKAFTLIELLVVIAIIGILVAIMMPALGRARRSSQSVKCLSNLRQCHIAASCYNISQNDFYPIAYTNNISSNQMVMAAWDFTTITQMDAGDNSVEIKPGILWRHTSNGEVQQCPSFKGNSNWLADPFTGYNYNTSYIGSGSDEAHPKSARTDSVRKPGQTALFGDGEYQNGANKFMRAPLNLMTDPDQKDITFPHAFRHAGTQGFRHLGKTSVVFCDGHVEQLAERHEAGHDLIAPNTGFLSEDNRIYDLR